eukprot:3950158-Heterocapsa_arctica.AAC.1
MIGLLAAPGCHEDVAVALLHHHDIVPCKHGIPLDPWGAHPGALRDVGFGVIDALHRDELLEGLHGALGRVHGRMGFFLFADVHHLFELGGRPLLAEQGLQAAILDVLVLLAFGACEIPLEGVGDP